MPLRLVVATTNPGKVEEVAAYLAGIPDLEVLSLRDFPPVPPVEETEDTFAGNAARKAIEHSRAIPGLVLADDSGLCVDSLGGEPGLRSARYGGPGLDDAGRCRLLLEKMEGVPDEKRSAWFECALAVAAGGRLVGAFTGRVEGRILREARGRNGFGYDPVFLYVPAGRTFAEMSREEKSAVSHRGRSLADLRRWLAARQAEGGREPG